MTPLPFLLYVARVALGFKDYTGFQLLSLAGVRGHSKKLLSSESELVQRGKRGREGIVKKWGES